MEKEPWKDGWQAALVRFQPGDSSLYTVGLALLSDGESRQAAGFSGGDVPVYLFSFNVGTRGLYSIATDAIPMERGYMGSRMPFIDGGWTLSAAYLAWHYLIGDDPDAVVPEELGWKHGWQEQLEPLRRIVLRAEEDLQRRAELEACA